MHLIQFFFLKVLKKILDILKFTKSSCAFRRILQYSTHYCTDLPCRVQLMLKSVLHTVCFILLKMTLKNVHNGVQFESFLGVTKLSGKFVWMVRQKTIILTEVRFLNFSMGPKSWVELTPPRPGQLGRLWGRLNSTQLLRIQKFCLSCLPDPWAWVECTRIPRWCTAFLLCKIL